MFTILGNSAGTCVIMLNNRQWSQFLATVQAPTCVIMLNNRQCSQFLATVQAPVNGKVKSTMARSLSVENPLPQNVGSIINWELPASYGSCSLELPGAADRSQLRTIASETVDPTDWPLLPPYIGQYPLNSTYCTVQMRVINHKTCCSHWDANARPSECQANALPVRPLRHHKPVLLC